MEQRKSQIDLLNFIERRDSKEFLFPDENLLHRRRASADYDAPQSEDDDRKQYEVRVNHWSAEQMNIL